MQHQLHRPVTYG